MVIIWNKNIKEFIWRVVSDKMNKSRVVEIESIKVHPIYKKRYKVLKKFYVHDENNISKLWDLIKIRETKPLSKLKRWVLIDIIEKAND